MTPGWEAEHSVELPNGTRVLWGKNWMLIQTPYREDNLLDQLMRACADAPADFAVDNADVTG
jgi:hypothetical protein